MIHKAKALTFLKEFDKAREEFDRARLVDPKQTALVDGSVKFLFIYLIDEKF